MKKIIVTPEMALVLGKAVMLGTCVKASVDAQLRLGVALTSEQALDQSARITADVSMGSGMNPVKIMLGITLGGEFSEDDYKGLVKVVNKCSSFTALTSADKKAVMEATDRYEKTNDEDVLFTSLTHIGLKEMLEPNEFEVVRSFMTLAN